MPSGTAGTPTATKGTVSNHAVTVTPSVTNTTGYISGGTKTGTGVSVSASELVSGTKSITENGTGIDVTNYASVNVSIDASTEFLVTFSKNQNDEWMPDCSFDDVSDAHEAGKTIVGTTNGREAVTFEFIWEEPTIYYVIIEGYNDLPNSGVKTNVYEWTDQGAYVDNKTIAYNTTQANAVPSDVASGKIFYNAQGYQTGTASGGAPILQTKSKTYTPTESQQTETITADNGYDGLAQVNVTVNAVSSTYVGTGITRRSSTDLTVSGATVTAPAGYYSAQASKTVASGTATPAATISGTAATVSTGTNTITLTKSISNTPTVSAGYITAGTAGNSSVSLTANVTTKAAATITPTTTNQTIAAGTYLTGIQTIAGDADLIPANIKSGVTIFGVTGTMSSQTYVNGDNLAYGGE